MNQQAITPQNLSQTKDNTLKVNEIFYSLQGEGPWQGLPVLFIRLATCNLRCTWCDTQYTTYTEKTPVDILHEVKSLLPVSIHKQHIVITGGEPFVQNIVSLIDVLYHEGYKIQIETNGTLSIPNFPWYKVFLVCSPKINYVHPHIQKRCRHFKYVLSSNSPRSEVTGLPASPTQTPKPGARKIYAPSQLNSIHIWVMPNSENYDVNKTVALNTALKYGYRYSTRLHVDLKIK